MRVVSGAERRRMAVFVSVKQFRLSAPEYGMGWAVGGQHRQDVRKLCCHGTHLRTA